MARRPAKITSGRLPPRSRQARAIAPGPPMSGPQELPALVAPVRMTATRQRAARRAIAKSRAVPSTARSTAQLDVLRAAASRDAARLLDSGLADHSSLTAIEQVAVGAGTAMSYAEIMAEFRRRILKGKVLRPRPEALAQRLVLSHLCLLFKEKRSTAEGMKFLASVGHFHPSLGRSAGVLPRARRLFPGWSRMQPAAAQVPPPHCVVCAVVVEIARDGYRDMSVATLLAHQCYLRPDEFHSLRRQDLIPRHGSQGAEASWSLLLGPIDLRLPTKTGIFDDCVLVDNPSLSWIPDHLRRLRLAGKLDGQLWQFSRANYTRVFGRAVRRLSLSAWGFVPYSLRHSGTSWDRSS